MPLSHTVRPPDTDDSKAVTNDVETFEADTNLNNLGISDEEWELSMDLPGPRLYHGAATVNEEVYVVGGRGDANTGGNGDDLGTLFRFDALTGEWDDMTPMSKGRIYLGVAGDSAADLVYAVGGIDGGSHYLRDAECYDVRTDSWRSLPDM